MKTINQFKIAETLIVESRGKQVTLNLESLPDDVIAYAALHGLKQKIGDAAAGAARIACGIAWDSMSRAERKEWTESHAKKVADTAQELMQDMADRLANGEWEAQRATGQGRAPADPIGALATKNAKAALSAMFQQITGARKIAAMVAYEKVAPFFVETSSGHAWREEAVAGWMAKQAESGKRDFMAEAKATIDGVEDLDLDF